MLNNFPIYIDFPQMVADREAAFAYYTNLMKLTQDLVQTNKLLEEKVLTLEKQLAVPKTNTSTKNK